MAYGVDEVPSIWDYLGQGISQFNRQGIVASERERERRQQEIENQQRELENKFRNFQVMSGLAGQGLIDKATYQQAAAPFLPPDTEITGETPLQTRARILKLPKQSIQPQAAKLTGGEQVKPSSKGPLAGAVEPMAAPVARFKPAVEGVQGRDQVSEDELRIAGLETPDEAAAARLNRYITDKKLEVLAGGGMRANIVAGVPQEENELQLDERLSRITKWAPVLDDAAGNFVAAALAHTGGRVNPNLLRQYADRAFSEWMKSNRMDKSKLQLPPDLEEHARGYFARAVRDELLKQQMLDVQRLSAMARETNNDDDILRSLNGIVQTQLNQVKVYTEGPMGVMIQHWADSDPLALSPDQQRQIAPYMQARRQLQDAINNRNKFAASRGLAPKSFDQVLREGADETVPEGSTPPPSGSASNVAELRAMAAEAMKAAKTEGARKKIKDELDRIIKAIEERQKGLKK